MDNYSQNPTPNPGDNYSTRDFNTATNRDILQAPVNKELPTMLNVLTILTLIGSGLYLLLSIYNFYQYSQFETMMSQLETAQDQLEGSGMEKMMEGTLDMAKKSYENRYLLVGSGIVGALLTLFAALQMRKRKKLGFPVYVVGELLPLVVSLAILGMGNIFTGLGQVFWIIVAVVFIILYATQRKHLIY